MMVLSPKDIPRSERILRNAYRTLGLSGDSSWEAATVAAVSDRETPWDLPWLGAVARTPADRNQALNRLVDPSQRLRERLFWFHDAAAEEAVRDLDQTKLRNALEGWGATSLATAHHDAALVALLAAMVLDPRVEDVGLWSRTIDQWRQVLDSEAYWVEVIRVEREGGFEVPAPFGEIYEAREKSLGLVLELPIGIARAAVLDDDGPTARRAIEALRQVLPPELFDPLVGDLAERTEQLGPVPSGDSEGGGVIPLATPRPGPRDGRSTRPAAETLDSPGKAPAAPPPPAGHPAAPTSPDPAPPATMESSSLVTLSSGAVDPTMVARVPAPRARERPPHRSVRSRPSTPVAAGLAIILAAGLALALEKRSDGERSEADPDRMRSEHRALAALDEDLLHHEASVAELLLARHEADSELETVRATIDDYRELAADYRRRLAYRLEVDREAHARVVRRHNATLDHYRILIDGRAGLEQRLNDALAQERTLLRRYNQHASRAFSSRAQE